MRENRGDVFSIADAITVTYNKTCNNMRDIKGRDVGGGRRDAGGKPDNLMSDNDQAGEGGWGEERRCIF